MWRCFLNLHGDGLHPETSVRRPLTRGTPTRLLSLIEGGTLRNFLHSEATARAFGVQPTGHAGLGAKVSVGPDWFVMGSNPQVSSGGSLNTAQSQVRSF